MYIFNFVMGILCGIALIMVISLTLDNETDDDNDK